MPQYEIGNLGICKRHSQSIVTYKGLQLRDPGQRTSTTIPVDMLGTLQDKSE